MEKILFLGRGSDKDPGFYNTQLNGSPFEEHMEGNGITVLNRVESCHGCPDLIEQYSKELQSHVEQGNRVVAVLEGGKYFALPSIQATQVTFPIISVPCDYTSFQSFMLPKGHATVATVGVDPSRKTDHYSNMGDNQKSRALLLAERILNLECKTVNVACSVSTIKPKLEDLGIDSILSRDKWPGLSIAYSIIAHGDRGHNFTPNNLLIRADSNENLLSWEYLKQAEIEHHKKAYKDVPTAQVSGLDNLAIFTAKIISLQRPELIPKIKEIAEKKRKTYEGKSLLEKD